MTRAIPLLFLLCSCASPRTLDVTLLTHAGEPFVMRDKGACVIVVGREIGYSELGRMVRECYMEGSDETRQRATPNEGVHDQAVYRR